MESDIVERLRGVQHNILADMTREAADEIERLRAELAASTEENIDLFKQLVAMRQQRDEARREWCYMESCKRNEYGMEPADEPSIAAERGWDCFKQGGGA